eukprot:TRINITY_DN38483_c0_g1_i1.p1 TRINITY_DN38483_c0_g1~~TRINITY_DN38483_c0_g1_i1.p1  ORF type:complete len:411 (+),score=127.34 TRINITY_DN38483_c0_g1_i1:179-1234(+)
MSCHTSYTPAADELSFCVAKEWMLNHLPEKDLYYLPPAVSVTGASMLDDTLAFAMMADKASPYSKQTPLDMKLAYILPHSDLMESVQNWRPLFFAKFFSLVTSATSTMDAVSKFVAPNRFVEWTEYPAVGMPKSEYNYSVVWHSSTSPPIASPWDFLAYGYGSCSAWATILVYTCRAVGIPARVVGSPCWNTAEFAGLATENVNVSKCWIGGENAGAGPVGGIYLNNHNWVEAWDSEKGVWNFINVPPSTAVPNQGWQCANFSRETGCAGGSASYASLDHPIFAYTWSHSEDLPLHQQGGEVLSGQDLRLTTGEPVSPLVWSPYLQDPMGRPISHQLRFVNRTDFYRNRAQ